MYTRWRTPTLPHTWIAQDLFYEWDTDGSGTLDKSELDRALKSLGYYTEVKRSGLALASRV